MIINNLLAEVTARYADFGTDLLIDAVAIFVMAYVLYFRRHWRADLLLSFITLNFGIFAVMSVLTVVKVDVATGFGLFAILSIIRLRSSSVTQQEVAYYFVALVLGLVNGLNLDDRVLVVALNVLMLAVMAVFDSKAVRDRARHVDVQLKNVYDTDAALVADLERELGGRVMSHEVTEIDLGRHHTTVNVRYRPGVRATRRGPAATPIMEPVRPAADAPAAEMIEQPAAERTLELVPFGAGESTAARTDRTE
jgi:Domain of unknown function (DUF4956)